MLFRYVSRANPPRPISSITPLTITPVGAIGDSEPALAPMPTMIDMRKGGIPTCQETAMAIGATSAVAAILPGPIEASPNASRKNIIGMTPTLPRAYFTARYATRSSVPLSCACENRRVTPANVRNKRVGNPPITSRALIPAT